MVEFVFERILREPSGHGGEWRFRPAKFSGSRYVTRPSLNAGLVRVRPGPHGYLGASLV